MHVYTIDFETYYDTKSKYSLKMMSTEDYVFDERFEIIGVGVWRDDEPVGWFSGTEEETKEWLEQFDLEHHAVAGHHLIFDGLVLARLGIYPKFYACTESMCRPFLKPRLKSLGLASVATYLGLGVKGDDVMRADGMRRKDFTDAQLRIYLENYCLNGDCRLTRGIYNWARPQLPAEEMRLIDMTLRMYLQPMFQLDAKVYEQGLADVRARKEKILREMEVQGITADVLRSNDKFPALLRERGIEVPMKASPASLKKGEVPVKMIPALGKADPEFIALREEYAEDLETTMLLNARVSEKSTQEETRNQTFLDIARRYPYLRCEVGYYNAHTGRYTAKEQDRK